MRLQIHVVPGGSPATAPAACSFLEIASPTLTLEALCTSISNRFERLYPHRPPLKIDRIQDSNGNDLDLGYLVSDVFSDKLEDNLNSIVRVLQKSTLRESSIPPESSLRPQFARKRRRLGTVMEVNSNASQEPAPSAHSSERGRMRERFPKRPRISDYVVQDSMDDREEGEERWRRRTGHDNKFDAGHDGNCMVEVAATQQSGQLSPSLGNRTPSPEIAITGTAEHPGQAPFIEVNVEDKEPVEEIQEIHYSPYVPQEPDTAEPGLHSSPILPPNPTQITGIVTNGIRRSVYDIPTSSSSEDELSLPVSSRSKKGRQRNGNSSQSPGLRKRRAEEARLAAEKTEKERAKEQEAAREKAVKAAEAREKAVEAERERLAKEKAEAERREKERKEAELREQKRIAAEEQEKQRREEKRKSMEKAQHEARIAAEKAEKEKLERERIANERLAKEKAEKERLAEEKREQEGIVKGKAEQEKAERERLEKERIQREKEEALNEKKEAARKLKLAHAAEKRAQTAKKRVEKLEREKAEKAEKLEREKAEKARKQAEYEANNHLAKEARKQAKEKAKGLALSSSSGKETPSSQLLPQPPQVLMADSESPVPTPNSTLKRSNLKAKILEGSRKRSSVSFAEDLTEISSPTPAGKKDTPVPALGSKVTPILPPGYGANKLVAEAVVMKIPAKPAAGTGSPAKKTKLAILPPKPTTAKKASPQPSSVPAQVSPQGWGTGEPALKSKPSPESDDESEYSIDEDSGESDSEEEEEAKPSPKSSAVKKSTARVKSAKNASPLLTLKASSSAATNSLKTPPSTYQSSQRSTRPSPQLARKTPIIAPATPATETDSESGSEEDEEVGSASESDFDPAPTTKPATSTKTNPPPPQPYRSLSDLEKMPVPDVHDIHSSRAPPNPPPSGTVRKAHDGDDDSSEESSESAESSDDEGEVAGKQVINSAKKAAAAPAKKGGFLSNFWGRTER